MAPLEPWQKVIIQLAGRQKSFSDIDAVHGLIGCSNCHGGNEPATYDQAHANGFLADPSQIPEAFCTPCHENLVETNQFSMHSNAWGEMTSIAQRELGGDKNHNDFDNCPEALTDNFEKECSSCHTTCGQCHVSRPNSVQKGLINNHKFNKKPDQENNCMACHGSRIGADFRGELEGNEQDVHYKRGMHCNDCHTEDFHEDARYAESRYHITDLPQCADCHEDAKQVNTWHLMHWPDGGVVGELSCNVCHSQPYNNCNNCHTNGEWKQGLFNYAEYHEFRIGMNEQPDLHKGKWAVVRHIPISRDSYTPWGHSQLATYDEVATWKYSSPHNIIRFTAQTDTTGGKLCNENCHLNNSYADMNQKIYLWQSFVDSTYPDELNANSGVIINGHLPQGWPEY